MQRLPVPVLFLALLVGLPACFPAGERAAAGEAGPAAADAAARPPNVIFVMADDLGYGDLGAYGQARIRTPNLDRMAREGTRFTQYYSGSTVCAPSRAVLMTGLHTGHNYVRNNVGWKPRGDVPLRPQDVSVAEVLRQAGYRTGAFGKWALGLKNTTGAPHRKGFEAFFGYEDQTEAHHYYVSQLQRTEGGRTFDVAVDSTRYAHDLIVDAALRFIRAHRDEPFFVYLPVTIPHAELAVPEGSLRPYLDAHGRSLFPETGPVGSYKPHPTPNAAYAAMISHLDRDMGRLLALLRELGLEGRTIVFFTSDNGPHTEGGHDPDVTDSNGPLRGVKRDLYEGGIRVPMIAWGPGRVPAGRVSDQVWAAWDVLPTLADLGGAEAPAGIDGRSMAEVLLGRRDLLAHDPLYWEFHRRGDNLFVQAVRDGDWKAVRFTTPGRAPRLELYDLGQDPGETQDVAAARPDVAARLDALLDAAHTEPELEEFRMTRR